MTNRSWMACLSLLLAACSAESISPVDESRTNQHLTGPFTVTGTITGPGGVSICSLVTGQVRIRLYLPTGSFAGSQNICPVSNTYTLSVPGGTYYLQVALPLSSTLGNMVLRSLDAIPLDVTADMVRDFQVEDGLPLSGGMTLDGLPVNGGGSLSIYHGELQNVISTSALTLPSGAWYEPLVRPAVYLQTGASYRVGFNCQMLAADMATRPPAGPLVFPTELSSISCDFTSNTASSRTHFNNRLVVTADAGDFGAQAPAQVAQRGRGWGVQFPVGPAGPVHFPMTANQLYTGGLLFGFASGEELSTVDLTGYGQCGASCMDFDVSASPSVTADSPGKVVNWRYSDAISPESMDLQVTQSSYDGAGDYVLYRFVVRNTGTQTRTFWAGTVMDWDIQPNGFDDQIATALGGTLMYVTNPAGGTYLGSMLLGQPISGNYAYGSSPTCGGEASASQRVAALMGTLNNPSQTSLSCDKRYVHGAGPIALSPGYQTDFWVAIVAGTDQARLLATAAAAQSDWQQRGQRATIGIDIQPGTTSNRINTRGKALVPVAILGDAGFDVTALDVTTVVFGPGGAAPVHDLNDPSVLAGHLQDVNGDGHVDLTTHFRLSDTGLTVGTSQACVNGVTLSGTVFNGCDVVQVK